MVIKEYLNSNSEIISKYDPISLIKNSVVRKDVIKIDVGLNDEYLKDLYISEFEQECIKHDQKIDISKHKGYGHNYYFVQTFIRDHIEFHYNNLKNKN